MQITCRVRRVYKCWEKTLQEKTLEQTLKQNRKTRFTFIIAPRLQKQGYLPHRAQLCPNLYIKWHFDGGFWRSKFQAIKLLQSNLSLLYNHFGYASECLSDLFLIVNDQLMWKCALKLKWSKKTQWCKINSSKYNESVSLEARNK